MVHTCRWLRLAPTPAHANPALPGLTHPALVLPRAHCALHCSAVPGGYGLLLEAAQLLLALGSSVLYSPSPRGQLGQHPYLDAAMRQRDLANPSECR